ncbi:SMP-30/gluconolactonase/LRE family protein [Paraburkholderia sp.]|uniref:SMP-30/gluconolactonase/LRE family protein n=1 Tax=Paraburkholderia sp. TaxID=1926495 RepID=UPI003C7B08DD
MKVKQIMGMVASLVLSVAAVHAEEVTVVKNVLGPEGPLYLHGNLYYVAWTTGTLNKWDGKKSTVLNDAKNCGHNGLALTKQNTFLIMCSADPGMIIETEINGKEIRRWTADNKGNKFVGGLNDVVVAANGGAYATIFGPYIGEPTLVEGKILYLAPGAKDWVDVADDLNYANGIAVSPDQKTLYVSETVGNSMKKFTINPDGTLSNRTNYALLNLLVKDKVQSAWLGPDSMKVDREGNVYIAQWSGGKVLKISPDGKLLHTFEISAGDGTTNMSLDDNENYIYVTVVKDPKSKDAAGSIVRITNVK